MYEKNGIEEVGEWVEQKEEEKVISLIKLNKKKMQSKSLNDR